MKPKVEFLKIPRFKPGGTHHEDGSISLEYVGEDGVERVLQFGRETREQFLSSLLTSSPLEKTFLPVQDISREATPPNSPADSAAVRFLITQKIAVHLVLTAGQVNVLSKILQPGAAAGPGRAQ